MRKLLTLLLSFLFFTPILAQKKEITLENLWKNYTFYPKSYSSLKSMNNGEYYVKIKENDDGQEIEPKFYVPTLPVILINGACGIGTGFSTDVPCFNPDDIKERLETQDKIYEDFFHTALQEILLEKYPLYNRNSDRGYMIHINDMFLFQPYFNQDEFLPLYYRLNRGSVRENEFLITSQAKRLATVDTEARSFSDEYIILFCQHLRS